MASAPTLRRTALGYVAVLMTVFATPAVQSADAAYDKDRRDGEARCRGDLTASAYVDCACVGEEIAKDVAARGKPNSGDRDMLAWNICPQKNGKLIEEASFKSCDSYQSSMRTDHEQYCRCVGQHVAREYIASPKLENRYIQMLQRNGLVACGADIGSKSPKPSRAGAEWTPAGLEKQRAEQEASCRQNNVQATFNDCACVGRKSVELATAPGESRPVTSYVTTALEACPQQDRPVIARYIFDACHSYMVSVRTDHESFCKCTADGFVQRFYAEKPLVNQRWREKLRRDAMNACGLGDQSKRLVTTTPVDAAVAASGCVKFYSNEKRILENVKWNQRFRTESRTSPDVVAVSQCGKTIRLITGIEYTTPRKDAVPQCVFKLLWDGEQVELRSQSKVVRSGLDPRIPVMPPFLCLGNVSEAGSHPVKSDCACSSGFQRVDIPLSAETLKPLP